MSTRLETISPEDLLAIRQAQFKAEKAQLELSNITLKAFLRYGLTEKDRINADGTITREPNADSQETA